jgi:DNA-binding IclR family transcriptional regulator
MVTTAEQSLAGTVPALERGIAVLRYLEENLAPSACTVSRIAEALGLHKSTCSNILRTLEAAAFLEYDADAKAYRLGPELIGLGASASSRRDSRQIELRHVEALVRDTGFSVVVFEQLPSSEFLMVAKVDSFRDIKVTIDVGQHFPPWAPALARIALAWQERDAAAAYFARWQARPTTPSTITDPAALLAELDRVRERGYAVSVGEYYPANTAISAPIFAPRRDRCRGICLVAFTAEIAPSQIPALGQRVQAAARAITRALGGTPPQASAIGAALVE